ncbi:TetR/AcrR family transcriptional regulator [Aquibium microcysteis]|uniref:TetR/AcrR family transcriptional regulator n=1 Tax=Aquibium microcysteis TaxID=675281 RepID=UPI00165D198D|nr:TetR/AcrR family transcriptional regulator [Aquibium microcysteis]
MGIDKGQGAKAEKRQTRASPRTPSRGRGILRYEGLLDSLEALLVDHDLEDVGLSQIAEHARVPPASVYHFFPTKEAAFMALVQRYVWEIRSMQKRRPVPHSALRSWQEFLAQELREAVDFFRTTPQAMKLFLGRYGGMETWRAELAQNAAAAHLLFRRLNSAFHLPLIRDAEAKFLTFIEVVDAVLGISYARDGDITDEALEEAHRASVAYCKLFLPEQMELREDVAARVARGEPVILDPGDGPPCA